MSRTDPVPLPAVLIVEDDPTIGHHLHLGLEGHGYRTTWCRTGAAALIHARDRLGARHVPLHQAEHYRIT